MKKTFIFITTVLVLSGCGSTGSSSGSSGGGNPPPSSDIEMIISEPYTVFPGDQLIKSVPEALVRISHIDGKDESTVVLLEGSAIIIRK